MSKLSKCFIVIGLFLIIVSISMFIYNEYEDMRAGKKSEEALSRIKDNYDNNLETININNYDYMGIITIPSLNIELPVMSLFSDENLKIAPTRYYGAVDTNDLVICGHSYKTHFRYLNRLKQNDIVIFTDINGVNYIYEVLEIEILNSKDVSKMLNSKYDLTLYTCTSDGINRVTVRCNRIDDKTI